MAIHFTKGIQRPTSTHWKVSSRPQKICCKSQYWRHNNTTILLDSLFCVTFVCLFLLLSRQALPERPYSFNLIIYWKSWQILNSSALCDVAPCSFVHFHQHFVETCCHLLQDWRVIQFRIQQAALFSLCFLLVSWFTYTWIFKMEADRSSETLAKFCGTIWNYFWEGILHSHCSNMEILCVICVSDYSSHRRWVVKVELFMCLIT
jgi:hypothetical protein